MFQSAKAMTGPLALTGYSHPEVDRICGNTKVKVFSKIRFYLLQDGCILLRGSQYCKE